MIISYHGAEKTGKTTFGFTCPKPILHLDFDMGRDRAIPRFKESAKDIWTIPLPEPPEWTIGSGAATKLWASFEQMFSQGMADPQVKTIFIDTGTQMWKANTQEYLENYVRKVNPSRLQLIQIEYRVPNDRMRAKFLQARNSDKLLVVSHYETNEYRDVLVVDDSGRQKKESMATGKRIHAGFNELRNLTDIHLALWVDYEHEKPVPMAIIQTPGVVPFEGVGQQLSYPSYDNLMALIQMLRGE